MTEKALTPAQMKIYKFQELLIQKKRFNSSYVNCEILYQILFIKIL